MQSTHVCDTKWVRRRNSLWERVGNSRYMSFLSQLKNIHYLEILGIRWSNYSLYKAFTIQGLSVLERKDYWKKEKIDINQSIYICIYIYT